VYIRLNHTAMMNNMLWKLTDKSINYIFSGGCRCRCFSLEAKAHDDDKQTEAHLSHTSLSDPQSFRYMSSLPVFISAVSFVD